MEEWLSEMAYNLRSDLIDGETKIKVPARNQILRPMRDG
jgi:hypothetical protein